MPSHSSLRKHGKNRDDIVRVEGSCGHCAEDISISIMTDRDYDIEPQLDVENFFLICPDCLDSRADQLWPYVEPCVSIN